MGGYFSAQPQIRDDSSSSQNSEPSLNKIQDQVHTERSLNQLTNREQLDEFKLDLARKHERRREILAQKRKEMEDLRQQVQMLKQENEILRKNKPEQAFETIEIQQLRRENEELKIVVEDARKTADKIEDLGVKNNELRVQIAEMQKDLQVLNSEAVNFEQEREDYQTHVVALKDVIKVSKHMLQIREAQLKELKDKVENIEQTLASREMNILSQDLREEYERQLLNIRNLRQLYEERHRANKLEKEELATKLEETTKELEDEHKKNQEQNERITQLETENSNKYDEIKSLQSDYGLSKAECREYQAELAVINQLFSQILLGFNNTQAQGIDLDKLKTLLEENHGLLQNIVVNEISKEVSSILPKVLLDLVNQVKEKDLVEETDQTQIETEPQANSSHQLNSVEEIVENLPKVWRVLIELLSHQKAPITINLTEEETQNPCYKRVETTKGPNLVISVSQTYIHLKNLILEKKSLEKETNNLKQLNGHLESRLQDQEKRLETVTSELSKTWHVVGKLQKQHNLLHTQEKILRYELAQKRKLLGQLREELEYSREKWLQAREKNTTTEREWKQLRKEFASRRNIVTEDINNSCESGYSDDRECSSSDDEPGYETDVSECNQKPVEEASSSKACDQNPVEDLDVLEEKVVEQAGAVVEEAGSSIVPEEIPNPNDDSPLKTEEVQPLNHEKTESTNKEEITEPSTSSKQESSSSSQDPEGKSESTTKIDVNKPSTSRQQQSQETPDKPRKTLEEVLAARDERLKRLESEAKQLVTKVTNTNIRSGDISKQLDDLHEVYGESSSNTEDLSTTVNSDDNNNNNNNDNQE
ncbi:unnamed protein product [Brassicogethes aeneus]|uniref:Uncharacterized protein n=1 Tax=Brassicogethes aeneus TaxID=1431903 RepID=A0A9P0APX1_BRAAE|nr:unnamed protein product [Brassicogethes aeneus]